MGVSCAFLSLAIPNAPYNWLRSKHVIWVMHIANFVRFTDRFDVCFFGWYVDAMNLDSRASALLVHAPLRLVVYWHIPTKPKISYTHNRKNYCYTIRSWSQRCAPIVHIYIYVTFAGDALQAPVQYDRSIQWSRNCVFLRCFWPLSFSVLFSASLYLVASQLPQYLHNKRIHRGAYNL